MDNKLKQTMEKVKAFADKFSKKTKRLALIVGILIIGGSIGIALVLNHKEYTVLYSQLNDEEVQTILTKLKDSGVDYQYKGNGTILVDEKSADLIRVQLAEEGYPESGFAYDIFINNTGGMTTDSAEQTYKLYELQNRIGAEIRLFSGVKDAKVTIALGQEQKYALQSDDEVNKASASVVVIMKDGETLSEKQASAIQRLVAKSVANLDMSNVAVFDGNGIEVSTNNEEGTGSQNTAQELSQILEQQIERNIANVLTPIYGQGNVRVSAKGSFNMEKLIRETITYHTPDKIDENDKEGIVSKSSESSSQSNNQDTSNGGVAGTGSNSDIPQYNTTNGTSNQQSESQAIEREYLVNQIKEQGQIDAGVLEDLRVAVTINGTNYGSLTEDQLISLIGNASGIPNKSWQTKITVAAAPFYGTDQQTQNNNETNANGTDQATGLNIPWLIVAPVVGGLFLVILLFVLLARRRRKRRKEAMEYEMPEEISEEIEATKRALEAEKFAMEKQKELFEHQSARSKELYNNVQDFAKQNPEISAQMLKNWLRGGEENGRT